VAGDAANLPFADGSLQFVMAFQMLSQFMKMESVFLEVKRELAPGGVFLFAEEPLKRLLSMRLYRAPYYENMKPWERKLYDWGLLGYLVRDVIGAHQEESFGIRQNHTMGLKEWHKLITTHFADQEYEVFVPERGWGESVVKRGLGSQWKAARALGGTLAAVCKKAGLPSKIAAPIEHFETFLRCPDCHATLQRDAEETLKCSRCTYTAPNEGNVYNLLPSTERKELYPGDREDVIDFSLPGHAARLIGDWYGLEGVFGNKYRWIGSRASFILKRINEGPQRLRIRGHAHEKWLAQSGKATIDAIVNGKPAAHWTIERTGLFIVEADLPDAPEYMIELQAAQTWTIPEDDRVFTTNLSMIRLVPRD
jgi:hypothetical protein